jgi:hypothetical protein
MSTNITKYTLTQDIQVARPKPAKVLPVSVDDLTYIKSRISFLKPEISLFVSTGFFFIGSSLACFLQVYFGTFPKATPPAPTTNEIILWCMTIFCLIAAVGCFIFCYLRRKDCKTQQSDLLAFLNVLENKFERFDSN